MAQYNILFVMLNATRHYLIYVTDVQQLLFFGLDFVQPLHCI